MEHPSSRLYSGPLSEAAQKVLVALRAQSFNASSTKCRFSYNCSPMEENGSQGKPWTQSRSTSQSEREDRNADWQTFDTQGYYQHAQMYSDKPYCELPAHQSSQAPPFSEHELPETAPSFSHGERYALSPPIPKETSDKATFCTIQDPNEVQVQMMKKANDHNEESALDHHPFLFSNKGNVIRNSGTLGPYKGTEWWRNSLHAIDNTGPLHRGLKDNSNLTYRATDSVEDGKQSKSKTVKKIEKRATSETRVFKITEDTNSGSSSYLVTASNTDKGSVFEDRGKELKKTDSNNKAALLENTEDVMDIEQSHCSVVNTKDQCKCRKVSGVHREDRGPEESRKDGDESVITAVNSAHESGSKEEPGREGCLTLTPHEYRARESVIGTPCLHDNVQNNSSVMALIQTATNSNLPTAQTVSHDAGLVPSFPLKRKLLDQNVNHPNKRQETSIPKIVIPDFLALLEEAQNASRACELEKELLTMSKINHSDLKYTKQPSRQTLCSMTGESYKQDKFGPDQITYKSRTYHKETTLGGPHLQTTASCPTPTQMCDPRIRNFEKLNPDEMMQLFKEVEQTKTLVLTMVYQDGTTQLDQEKKSSPPVSGLLILLKMTLDSNTPEKVLGLNDSLVYLKLEQTPSWAKQHTQQNQNTLTRDLLLQVISRSQQVVCYKAKDLLRTVVQFFKEDFSWKQVATCQIHDPQVSGWLLDPADPSSCYQDLLNKHCKRPPALGTKKGSQVILAITSLYWLNNELCCKLQSRGLWKLYLNIELNMIPVLAAMGSHRIHVDKETLKRTSELLGAKMKQLEQEAHHAAGQIFLITSNSQLRTVLFEKLRLHELCENKKLPKTINRQQQSTSEATLLQLQGLHPLPKIILEYRQVHKIKSTFVDGILSCMISKNYISSTWYQTSAVTGRISAKHPNFQALPRQPLQITKKQSGQGQKEEVVTVHPRAVFIPQEGWTFVAADFCQVELRLLAHLSSDPELLRIFINPQADVFTMLASQWKGIEEDKVTSEDREHAKRIVYSIVYGAGCKRLSGILGVSSKQASQFQDSFLKTYKEVHGFVQRTILQCHKQGYALSIMGRQRPLPNINSPDWAIRMQAERQAVNFVVQGSAADLCKMAMIRIFILVSSSSFSSARLIAQLHDELLYEVEDSQVEHFAALVKRTMESLQHIHQFYVHLKVPLKVSVSSGKSWGSMTELDIP